MNSRSNGRPDPTPNVFELVEASIRRIDDLRDAETKRVNDLSAAEARRVDQVGQLRAEYEEKLRDAEAKRIDAIRAVDVNAVSVASGRASDQAAVLATSVQTSADTLRALVSTTATTLANQLTAIITPITDRLGLLEKAQYATQGRSEFANPAEAARMEEMVASMKAMAKEVALLKESGREVRGKDTGFKAGWGAAAGLVALVMLIIGYMLRRVVP